MIGKRGSLLTEESVKVIVAIAVVAGILLFLFKLFSPVFNVADETAKSYFETLSAVIEDVPSSFFIMDNENDELNFYLVYFGGAFKFNDSDMIFTRKPDRAENVICVCSESDEVVVCDYCRGLEKPASFNGDIDQWFVGEGARLTLEHKEGHYVFSSK